MSAQLTDEEALNRVASYCSTAEHCRAEINEKLQRWGIAYDTIARILDRLESEKFIDDERFCRAFVNDGLAAVSRKHIPVAMIKKMQR